MTPPPLGLVQRLIETQFPHYSALPLESLASPGTDNAIFRLGADFTVRLPKVDWAVQTPEREVAILSHMTGLSLDVPAPVALGKPGEGYPWPWSILHWAKGEPATAHAFSTYDARSLANFLVEMRSRPVDLSFQAGAANNSRGGALSRRADAFGKAALALGDEYDSAALDRIWDAAISASQDHQQMWLHGDLHGGNLLIRDGGLSGVIDWGLAGVGDGACDLAAGWTLFDGVAREAFFAVLDPDGASRLRGAGWALSIAVIFLAHYRDKGVPVAGSRRTIARLLEDFG